MYVCIDLQLVKWLFKKDSSFETTRMHAQKFGAAIQSVLDHAHR